MREREHILDLWRQMQGHATEAVLVTVVKTLGSSYRRPGARLLITETGQRAGSISGGCLEDDVVRKAWWLTENGPSIRRYDTTPDGDIGPSGEPSGGFGLGCNGIIYLLFQRVSGLDNGPSPLSLLARVHATRQPATLAHLLEPKTHIGAQMIIERAQISTLGPALSESLFNRILTTSHTLSHSAVTPLDSGEEVFFETLTPPVRLLIFGAGDDAVPLTELGRHLGWHVNVFDGRAHYARPEKFPSAQYVAVRDSTLPLTDLHMDSRTVAVVMTHSYCQDLNFVKGLVAHPLAYLGILGPRNRSAQILADLELDPAHAMTVHGPVGLDIGADGPEQVALSIISEIQAIMNGREGGPLRARAGSIHSGASDGQNSHRFIPSIVCA